MPVLFIPGNAGSHKQVRSYASEAAYLYHNSYRHNVGADSPSRRPLDFFAVDFNEDFTAFHGQTLLDQAEYLNDAISFILSLYHTPTRSLRDSKLPDPTSILIVGHSMGGVVARTMLTMPNYQVDSINTIITLAAPHARPPVSFDGDIVRTYQGVNEYWQRAYSQRRAIDNPLQHVTLISIAGGGLDTIVSSDYASLASLVPESHGFTVFTSTIPNAWTGADHLAITWCDQVRKSVVRALYEVIDASVPAQTISRAARIRAFRHQFLTGLEDNTEKSLPHEKSKTLLTIEKKATIGPEGQRLVLRTLGQSSSKPKVHLLPVPDDQRNTSSFTLLTSERLDSTGQNDRLEVLFCNVYSAQTSQSSISFEVNTDLSGDSVPIIRLACKNVASDAVIFPASTIHSTYPFTNDQQPFSYLQYNSEDFSGHQFIAVIDKAKQYSYGWVVAEFSDQAKSVHEKGVSLQHLLAIGLDLHLPAQRPLMNEIKVPSLHSSLLAYNLHVRQLGCTSGELFMPFVRQYITEVYESKYFVNIKDVDINIHGVAPYMPSPMFAKQTVGGLSFQLWTDPTCDGGVHISLNVDILGSLGKLWMRYRIVFAAFPLLIVALVLRHQFMFYDESGVFISFSESMNECMRTSIPGTLIALTILSVSLAGTRSSIGGTKDGANYLNNTDHELLLGLQDTFFWFLVPLFGLICAALCVAVNYIALGLVSLVALLYSLFPSTSTSDDDEKTNSTFNEASTRQRVITAFILFSLISTVIPYHLVYVVLCLVQLATCVRSLRLASDTVRYVLSNRTPLVANPSQRSFIHDNFFNYVHSVFILMLWILPINLPVLVVWIRNLMIHWLTPFSSHHNILSIMPFVLLVETLSTGRMIPRVQSRFSLVTNIILFSMASYAAVYGVTYAYVLHHLANSLCAWLVAIHCNTTLSVKHLGSILHTMDPHRDTKKQP